jgi:predicted ester cyclase
MRRSLAWSFSLVLAVATGAVFAQAATVLTTPPLKFLPTEHTAETVEAFYAAVNAVIRDGDIAALDGVVGPDFVDHTGLPGVTPDLSGLRRYLAALHLSAPDGEVVVEDLAVADDRALARVTLRGADQGAFLGITLDAPVSAWGRADVFRVAGRRVTERWGDASSAVFLETLGTAPLGTWLPTRAGIAFERITMRPGDSVTTPAAESRLLFLEAGSLTLAVDPALTETALVARADGTTGGAVNAGTAVPVTAGDFAVLPSSAAYTLTNDGAEPTTAIVAAIFVPGAPSRAVPRSDPALEDPVPAWPAGIGVRPLAGGFTTVLPQVSASAGVGRMILAPGGRVPEITAPGPLLLAVESGTVDVEIAGDAGWVRDGATSRSSVATSGPLDAGDGAFVPAGAILSFANLGDAPAGVLLVSLTSSASSHDR